MTIPNQLFTFLLTLLIMGVALDFMFRSAGPGQHAAYRRIVGRVRGFCVRHISRFGRWAWREYAQFIVGFLTGSLVVLYYTGHLR